VNAAFMSFQPHESGIHAVWPGADEDSVTKVRFRCTPRPAARGRRRAAGGEALPAARRERTRINLR
jgi:hypothetical protein